MEAVASSIQDGNFIFELIIKKSDQQSEELCLDVIMST